MRLKAPARETRSLGGTMVVEREVWWWFWGRFQAEKEKESEYVWAQSLEGASVRLSAMVEIVGGFVITYVCGPLALVG